MLLLLALTSAVASAPYGTQEVLTPPGDLKAIPTCASRLLLMVLNLDRRPDRLQMFEAAMPSALQVCRIPAVDGKLMRGQPPPSELVSPMQWAEAVNRSRDGTHPMDHWLKLSGRITLGGIGMKLAHALAWRHMVDKDLNVALIAEDDVGVYSPQFFAALEQACDAASAGTHHYIQMQMCPRGIRHDPSAGGEPVELVPGTEYCTGMYVLSRHGARMALGSAFDPDRPWGVIDSLEDGPLRAPLLRGAHCSPPVVGVLDMGSDDPRGYNSSQREQLRVTGVKVNASSSRRIHTCTDVPQTPAAACLGGHGHPPRS